MAKNRLRPKTNKKAGQGNHPTLPECGTLNTTGDNSCPDNAQGKFRTWIALGLIILLAFASYANALRGDFVQDDGFLIADNSYVKSWKNLAQNLTADFFQLSLNNSTDQKPDSHADQKTGYYRPIITLTYMLDYSLSGKNPLGYHLTNLLWHIGCGILIYFWVLVLFGEFELSLITGLLFVTHPVHTESVTWISGRTDVICAFFFFAALYLHSLAYLTKHRGKSLLVVCASIFFVLSLLAKEMAITFPLILMLVDYLFAARESRPWKLNEWIKARMPYWAALFIYLVIRFAIGKVTIGTDAKVAITNTHYLYLFTFGRAILYYLRELIYPIILNPYMGIELITYVFSAEILLVVMIFLLSLFLAYTTRKTNKAISLSLLFFWISISPLSNLLPVLSMADDNSFYTAIRYLYLPSFAFCLLTAVGLGKISNIGFKRISMGTIALTFLLLFYTGKTIHANTFWQNDTIYYNRALELSPRSPSMNSFAAGMYLKKKDYATAINLYLRAIELKDNLGIKNRGKNLSGFYTSLSRCYFAEGDLQKAIAAAQAAITYNEKNAEAHLYLSKYYRDIGQLPLSRNEINRALELDPSYWKIVKIAKPPDK